MSRPIEATPILTGEDADRLLRDVEKVCSPEEVKRRKDMANRYMRNLPNGAPNHD